MAASQRQELICPPGFGSYICSPGPISIRANSGYLLIPLLLYGVSVPAPALFFCLPLHTITLRLRGEGLPRGVLSLPCGLPLKIAAATNHHSLSRLPQERAQVEAASLSLCRRLLWKAKNEC